MLTIESGVTVKTFNATGVSAMHMFPSAQASASTLIAVSATISSNTQNKKTQYLIMSSFYLWLD